MASIVRHRESDLRAGPQPQLSKTCQNCSHAKIRCDRTQNLSACDRCHRLGKHCVFRPTKRRYNGTKRDMRIEALESKLEQLLQAQDPVGSHSASVSPEPPYRPERVDRTPPVTPRPDFVRSNSASTNVVASEGSRTTIGSSPYSEAEPVRDVIEAGLVNLKTAEYLLDLYKTNLTPQFPFVVLAPQVTVEELRQEKPFLLLSVLSASCYEDMPLQRALGSEMKQAISNRVILGGAISFELLQGLLIHLAWSQYHPRPRRYSQYLQLAISIIVDLRLDKPLEARSWKLHTTMRAGHDNAGDTRPETSAWGRDERRAVAGCYYLSSTVSLMLQKMSTFPYSASIEYCCRTLGTDNEYPTDKHLVHLVGLQNLMEKIESAASGHNTLDPANPVSELTFVGLKSDLESFKNSLPFSMNESHLLFMNFHIVELFLCQSALFDRTSNLNQPDWSSTRFDFLCTGLTAATAFFRYYISLPLCAELAFNNSEWIQISFALTVACKLAVTSSEKPVHGQTFALRRSLDMSGVLRQLALRTGALVSDRTDAQGDRDIFSDYEQRCKRMELWFNSHCHSSQTPPPSAPQQERPQRPELGRHRSSHGQFQGPWQYVEASPQLNAAYPDTTMPMATLPQGSMAPANMHLSQSHYPDPLLSWDGVSVPPGSYDLRTDSFLPDATIDDILGDWMTFPGHNM